MILKSNPQRIGCLANSKGPGGGGAFLPALFNHPKNALKYISFKFFWYIFQIWVILGSHTKNQGSKLSKIRNELTLNTITMSKRMGQMGSN